MSELSSFLRTEGRARKLNDDGIWELLEEAAAEIERLRAALKNIYYHYDNQDMNHVDFRVHAKTVADEAINGQLKEG